MANGWIDKTVEQWSSYTFTTDPWWTTILLNDRLEGPAEMDFNGGEILADLVRSFREWPEVHFYPARRLYYEGHMTRRDQQY